MTKTVRQVLVSFFIAMIFLAMFNSRSLITWAYDLEADTLSDGVSFLAEEWDEAMQDLGSAQVSEVLRGWFQEISGVSD